MWPLEPLPPPRKVQPSPAQPGQCRQSHDGHAGTQHLRGGGPWRRWKSEGGRGDHQQPMSESLLAYDGGRRGSPGTSTKQLAASSKRADATREQPARRTRPPPAHTTPEAPGSSSPDCTGYDRRPAGCPARQSARRLGGRVSAGPVSRFVRRTHVRVMTPSPQQPAITGQWHAARPWHPAATAGQPTAPNDNSHVLSGAHGSAVEDVGTEIP